jgi:alkyl hydroperoxide reductase subunit AhpC
LGSIAPNFDAETTGGPINFHDFIGNNWVVLFSHPEDFTPGKSMKTLLLERSKLTLTQSAPPNSVPSQSSSPNSPSAA